MQAVFENIKNIYSGMNRISHWYIKLGSAIVFSAFLSALFCRVSAGHFGNYDYLMYMQNEMLTLGKDMVTAIYVPALILETVYLVEKNGRT